MINLNEKEIRDLIENNPVALGTICEDNTPNVIAVSCAKVVSENEIIVTDNFMKQTRENILDNPTVCLAVWNKDEEGLKLIGKAEYHKDGKWRDFVKNMPENEGMAAKGAILIKVKKLIKLR